MEPVAWAGEGLEGVHVEKGPADHWEQGILKRAYTSNMTRAYGTALQHPQEGGLEGIFSKLANSFEHSTGKTQFLAIQNHVKPLFEGASAETGSIARKRGQMAFRADLRNPKCLVLGLKLFANIEILELVLAQ